MWLYKLCFNLAIHDQTWDAQTLFPPPLSHRVCAQNIGSVPKYVGFIYVFFLQRETSDTHSARYHHDAHEELVFLIP